MWEKIRVVFTIPELRQKILLTLLFLAIYRVGYAIPLPIFDQNKMTADFGGGSGASATLFNQAAIFSGSTLNQATDLRAGHHALHLRLHHLSTAGQRLSALGETAKGGRERAEENQRIYPLRDRAVVPGAKLGIHRHLGP